MRNSSQSCFAHWHILESHNSANTSSWQSHAWTILKFNNGAELSSTCMTGAIVNSCSLLVRKRTHMNCSLTGKITSTSLSKLKTSTNRTVMNFNRFSKKINGKNVSINEKVPSSHLSSIGVTTWNRLPSIPKTLSGNISLATIASCTPFWSK